MAQTDKQGILILHGGDRALERETAQRAEEAREANDYDCGLQGLIGERLRQYYDKRLVEPLPDKFASLLAKLAKTENKE